MGKKLIVDAIDADDQGLQEMSGDGVAMGSTTHPRPVWWKRLYYRIRCMMPLRGIETVWIDL